MLSNQKQVSTARKTRGYLEKKSTGFISIWQRRYFIILENSLAYYGDETLDQVKKSIQLSQINSIKVLQDNEFHLVTKKRIYELRSEKENDRDLWVASLNILINSFSNEKNVDHKVIRLKTNKIVSQRTHSRSKNKEKGKYSPPPLRKMSSMNLSSSKQEYELSEQFIFMQLGLSKLANACKQQHISNKIILIKQSKSIYFVISCKTPLYSHEDEDFLPQQVVTPFKLNTLYYCKSTSRKHQQIEQICRCSDIQAIQEEPHKLLLILKKKIIMIQMCHEKMELDQLLSISKRLHHVIQISKQYYNQQGIILKRNIDKLLYKFDSKEMHMPQIVNREIQKCLMQEKDGQVKFSFRKNLQELINTIKEIIDCCDVLDKSRQQFKQKFIKQFYYQVLSYIQKSWNTLSKNFSLNEKKKILLTIYDIWNIVKDNIKDSKMFETAISIHKRIMEHYEAQISSKINSCFGLEEKQILQQLNLEISRDNQLIEQMNTLFYSNNSYRQFHVDIRLILYDFHEMPIHEKILQQYISLFKKLFKRLSEETLKCIGKWKDIRLVLGTCNQIQCIKNSLFQEMYSKLTSLYKNLSKIIQKQHIRQLEKEISNTEILLIKNLFVITFSTINKSILGKSYEQLNIDLVCSLIVDKLKSFEKINKYVKKNIFAASFEQICYFYFTTIIKFNLKKSKLEHSSDFFIKKITSDLKIIGQHFQAFVGHEKIYYHLKDISLLKQFLICDFHQIKNICQKLKKHFGNSFTENAFTNLLTLRDMSEDKYQIISNQCQQVFKYSGDFQSSFASSSMQSFMDSWNNVRSRKSTLTISLNQFYENQQTVQQKKLVCSVWKQGYLFKKKITKNSNTTETKAFFKINHSRLQQYQSENQEEMMKVFELHNVKKCVLHHEKPYMFTIEFHDFRLQLKADSPQQAKQWIKNIYEEIGSLSTLKEIPIEKQRPSEVSIGSYRNIKDPSTMQSFKTVKDRSIQKNSSVSPKLKRSKPNSDKQKSLSPQKILKTPREAKLKNDNTQDSCYKCSRGFFF